MVMGTVQGHIMGLVLLYFYLHILSSCIAIMASKPRKHRSSKTDNELETSKFELDSSVQNKISVYVCFSLLISYARNNMYGPTNSKLIT